MSGTRITAVGIMAVAAVFAEFGFAQKRIPPGFYVEQVTENPHREFSPRMNNRGQFVFTAWLGETRQTQEIFLYDKGEVIQVTDDDIQDVIPDINDDGTMVWCRGLGPQGPFGEATLEIVMYRDGELIRLTDNDTQDVAPSINNAGHIVWQQNKDFGCGGWFKDIYMYDGQRVVPITTDGVENRVEHQSAQINDRDEIAWTRYDFCVGGERDWRSDIMRYSDGEITKISPDETIRPQAVTINNPGHVAWSYKPDGGRNSGIQLWQNGQTRQFTDWGASPRLNDRGDIYFIRLHEDDIWQAWLYRNREFWQLSDDPFWNTNGDINNAGEVAWGSGSTSVKDIRYMRSFPRGDLNCDGSVDFVDVEPFITALIEPDEYANQHPDCDITLGDINADGSVDLIDVEPFIELLIR